MSGSANGKPPLTPAEQADLLPSPKLLASPTSSPPPPSAPARSVAKPAANLLPPELDSAPEPESPALAFPRGQSPQIPLPGGSTEVTTAWSTHQLSAPALSVASGPEATIPPLISHTPMPRGRRLTADERAQFRLWKNAVLFAFFVGVLLLIFWLLARQ